MKKVKQIMRTGIPTLKPDMQVKEILAVMEKNVSFGLAVEDKGEIVGILTDGDLISAYCRTLNSYSYEEEKSNDSWKNRLQAFKDWRAKDMMSQRPKTINEDADVSKAADIIKKYKFRRLIVVDAKGKYVGLVNRVAILKGALE